MFELPNNIIEVAANALEDKYHIDTNAPNKYSEICTLDQVVFRLVLLNEVELVESCIITHLHP